MHPAGSARPLAIAAATAILVLSGTSLAAASDNRDAKDEARLYSRLYTPPPDPGAVKQMKELKRADDRASARLLKNMTDTPQAVWFTSGSPEEVRHAVEATVQAAVNQRDVPILVAYNLPFRDCSQYSSGGATDTAAYLAWIDAFAAGIGDARAMVMLEPDGLGIIPFHTDINGSAEWCQPRDAAGAPQPGANPEQRFLALNGAVDRLARLPKAKVYLDGTNSAWLGAGDTAKRLVQAGVQRAEGFFVNVSNYQATPQSSKYASWVSQCIAFAGNSQDGGWRLGHYEYCASQYYPATPGDFSTWGLTDAWYSANLGGAKPTAHYVVDTSRNGQGPNDMSAYGKAPYNQPATVVSALRAANWCNPPGAGLGLPSTTKTGVPLLDAYLWIKTPGQSDGSCDIAGGARAWDYPAYNPWNVTGTAATHFDPLWGMVDPAAGAWFPAQALELARKANPAS